MKKTMLFLIVALASLIIPLLNAAAQSTRNEEFAELVTTYQGELERLSERVREAATAHYIIERLEMKRQKHFQAWQRSMQENMPEKAGVELMFSKKYKELLEQTFDQVLEKGKKLLDQEKYEEAIISFRDILHIKPDHEAASLNLCQAHFYQGCYLLDNGAEREARAKIRQYHRYRKEFQECGTCGREKKAAYYEKGRKLCKEGIDEMNPQKRKKGLSELKWLQYIDPTYRRDDVRTMITRCGNESDCKEKLRAAIDLFKAGDTEAADQEMAEIRQNNSPSCNAFIASAANEFYSEGLKSFSIYKFDQTVSSMNLARFVSPAEHQQNTAPYIKISELLIKAGNLFDQQEYKAAISEFEKAGRLQTGNEDTHIRYVRTNTDLANKRIYEKRLERAVMLYDNLKSEFSYEGYLEVKSAFEAVCKGPSATPECFEYIKKLDQRYLKYLYVDYLNSEFSYEGYLEVKSAFEAVCKDLSATPECSEYIKTLELKYLKYHYTIGDEHFESKDFEEALRHFKAVWKVAQNYEAVESYIRVIENKLKVKGK